VKRKLAELQGLPQPELPAGDLAPCPCDSVAIVKAVAAGRVPLNWGRAVIDRYYDAGLRFCLVVYRMDPYQCFPPVVMYSAEKDRTEFKIPDGVYCSAFEYKTFLDMNPLPEEDYPELTIDSDATTALPNKQVGDL
jgi:hypothetical protein